MRYVLLCLCFQLSFSQSNSLKGVILNKTDSLPLAYINIYSDTYKFGSISNELGAFLLSYPDSIQKFDITISSLGFLTKIMPNTEVKDTIFLQESSIQLDEIVVGRSNNDINVVLTKAYDNIKNNYSNKRHLLKAFYRQTAINTVSNDYLRIIEADVGLQEYGILKALDRDRIKIYHYRKSEDHIEHQLIEKMAKTMFAGPNDLAWMKRYDFVKNFVKYKDHSLNYNNILDKYHFEFKEYQSINNSLVAVYSFYHKDYITSNVPENLKSKLYINLDDYAIIKVKYISLFGHHSNYKSLSPMIFTYTKIGDYYYLNQISNARILPGKGSQVDFYVNNLYVYEVITDRSEYDKIKRNETEEFEGDIYDKTMTFDEAFWNNYKVLPEIPLNDKMKILMEKDKTLKSQFEKNARN